MKIPVCLLLLCLAAPVAANDGVPATLWRSVMPDGRVVLGDRPEAGAAQARALGELPAPDAASQARAQRERDEWQRRSDALAARLQARDALRSADLAQARRAPSPGIVLEQPPLVFARPRVGGLPGVLPVAPVGVPPATGPWLGGPGVGAAAGQSAGFLGSGFAVSSP